MKRKYDINIISNIIKESFSYADVLRKLGIVPAGGNYATLKNFIKENDIDISHFSITSWNKGKIFGPKLNINEYLSNNKKIPSNELKKRLIKEGLKKHQCEKCGLIEWLGKPIPIELNHKDGNHYNNNLSNLEILCNNCHALTDNFRGRNINYDNITYNKYYHRNDIFKLCIICDKPIIKKGTKYCSYDCSHIAQKKIKISDKELLFLLEKHKFNFSKVGRILNVSDNAVRKHYKKITI